MCFQRVAFFSVGSESLATLLFAGFVGAYKFSDAWERLGERGYLVAKIDEQIAWRDSIAATGNSHRCRLRIAGLAGAERLFQKASAPRGIAPCLSVSSTKSFCQCLLLPVLFAGEGAG